MEAYTGLKVIWLEGNGFTKIEGLEHARNLKSLYLQENLIETIEGLDMQVCNVSSFYMPIWKMNMMIFYRLIWIH